MVCNAWRGSTFNEEKQTVAFKDCYRYRNQRWRQRCCSCRRCPKLGHHRPRQCARARQRPRLRQSAACAAAVCSWPALPRPDVIQ
jgi:hypothetical protein